MRSSLPISAAGHGHWERSHCSPCLEWAVLCSKPISIPFQFRSALDKAPVAISKSCALPVTLPAFSRFPISALLPFHISPKREESQCCCLMANEGPQGTEGVWECLGWAKLGNHSEWGLDFPSRTKGGLGLVFWHP